jgi:hypothetical protein
MPVLEAVKAPAKPRTRPAAETAEPRAADAAERFWDAADDAITRALSSDSQTFLHATRQEGGQ